MEKIKEYQLDGMILQIPLRYDKRSDLYIEDYSELIETVRFTPAGHPIMFAGEDACPVAEEATPGGCPDCGSCKHYLRAGEHTWIGICKSEARRYLPFERKEG